MTRVNVTPVTPNRSTGAALPSPTAGDAAAGMTIPNDGRVIVLAKNTNASTTARTIDFILKRSVDGVIPDRDPIAINAGASELFGPFPVNDYGNALDIDVSHAEMVLTAIRVP